MGQNATLHVKIDSQRDKWLRQLAQARGKSKGQMVREAISACYQTSVEELSLRQQQALAAYQGGYMSLGKLARDMGLHVLELRNWLNERGMEQRNGYGDEDAAHA